MIIGSVRPANGPIGRDASEEISEKMLAERLNEIWRRAGGDPLAPSKPPPQPSPPSILLSDAEIAELTGHLQKPRCQVNLLQKRGFERARVERGKVILERAHYEAVCRGEFARPAQKRDTAAGDRPRVRPIR